VVAEEVRNLAMRSANAAKNTAHMLEDSARNAGDGVTINQEVLKNLKEINDQINKVSQVMQEISIASDEQLSGAQQISSAVGRASSVTQQNAATAQESAASAHELNAQAEVMQDLVGTFRLEQTRNDARPLVSSPKPQFRPVGTAHLKQNSDAGLFEDF